MSTRFAAQIPVLLEGGFKVMIAPPGAAASAPAGVLNPRVGHGIGYEWIWTDGYARLMSGLDVRVSRAPRDYRRIRVARVEPLRARHERGPGD